MVSTSPVTSLVPAPPVRIYNGTGQTLQPGTEVALSGWNSANAVPTAILASRVVAEARAELLVVTAIANGAVGVVYPNDQIFYGVNVGAASVGDAVYLGTAGGFAFTTPPAGRAERIGVVLATGVTGGIYLFPTQMQILAAMDAIADEAVDADSLLQPTTTLGQVSAAGLIPIRAHYDFGVAGGAIGTLHLLADVGGLGATPIPDGFLVVSSCLAVDTILASLGAATVSLGLNTGIDLLGVTAYGSAPWASIGKKSLAPLGTGATMIELTAARDVSMVIAGAALTDGVFDVWLFGVKTE